MKRVKNYLDLIPEKNYNWKVTEGFVTVIMPHKGLCSYIAHRFFKRPEKSMVSLDEIGSFVWLCVNGGRSVGEIARLVDAKFSDKAHPLYERLREYFQIMEKYKFIYFKSGD